MQPESETRRIQAALKPLLKKNGYSYSVIARELNVSVPTMKRMLTKDDISIERLARICGLLGIQLHELLELTRSEDSNLYMLSPEEETFFAKNPSYLHFLMALHNERLTPREIQNAAGISSRSTLKYLAQLASMGLIQTLPNGRVKVRIQGLIGWNNHGVLGKVLSHDQIHGIVDRNLSGVAVDRYLELSGRMLHPDEYEAMKKEFREVVAKYRRISKMNSTSKDLTKMRRYDLLLMAERRPGRDFHRITELTASPVAPVLEAQMLAN